MEEKIQMEVYTFLKGAVFGILYIKCSHIKKKIKKEKRERKGT